MSLWFLRNKEFSSGQYNFAVVRAECEERARQLLAEHHSLLDDDSYVLDPDKFSCDNIDNDATEEIICWDYCEEEISDEAKALEIHRKMLAELRTHGPRC